MLLSAIFAPAFAALLLPVIGTLWWVYRSGDVSRERMLGSTMLLERAKLVSRSVAWQPPWRALIEAALMLAFIIALLDIRLSRPAELTVIAIDNGPRMAAYVSGDSGSGTRGQDRLTIAKAQALTVLERLAPDSQVVLVTLTEQSEILSVADAQLKLNDVSISYQPGVIVEAAARARSIVGAEFATVISEGNFTLPKPEWIRWISVADSALNNLALLDFDYKAKALTVASYAELAAPFVIEVLDENGNRVALRRSTIDAGATRRLSLQDIESFPQNGSISLQAATDALPLDNTHYFTAESLTGEIVVDSPVALDALGLSALSQFKFMDSTQSALKISPAAVLHHRRSAPDSEQARNCNGRRLIVMPEGVAQPVGPERATWWLEADELLRYVNFNLLSLPLIVPLPTSGASILVDSSRGTLVTRSVDSGCDTVTVGFELFPFARDGDKTVGILTLNLLSWLAQGSASDGFTFRVPPGLNASRVFSQPLQRYESGASIREPGLFKIEPKPETQGTSSWRAESFVSQISSDLRRNTIHRAPSERVADSRVTTGAIASGKRFSFFVLCIAALLLLLDSVWYLLIRANVARSKVL